MCLKIFPNTTEEGVIINKWDFFILDYGQNVIVMLDTLLFNALLKFFKK
jgi:hypothetical protein